MPYRAQEVRVSNEELLDLTEQINRELDQVERTLGDNLFLPQNNEPPAKPRDGQIAYADGVNWDPGDGEGIYAFFNAIWNKLANGNFLATRSLQIVLLENQNPIPVGTQLDFFFSFNCIIQSYTILADQSTTCTVDLFVDLFANYPPVVGDSITGGNLVQITASDKNQDTTLTGWSPNLSAGQSLRVNVTTNDNAERLTIALEVLVL